jgi:hypothetical protein
MQVDQPGCGKTPFVPDAFLRKLNELPCQLSASDIPAYRHAAGSIIPIPSAVERPCKRLSDVLIIRHKVSLTHGKTQPTSPSSKRKRGLLPVAQAADKVVRIRSLHPDPRDNRRMEKMQAILGITSYPPHGAGPAAVRSHSVRTPIRLRKVQCAPNRRYRHGTQ